MIGVILIVAGLTSIGLYFFVFRMAPDKVALTKWKPQGYEEGWHLGFLPSTTKYISLKRNELKVPTTGDEPIGLRAPDGGRVGVSFVLLWSHDPRCPNAYTNTQSVEETNSILLSRARSALNYWIQGKPFPGTAKRALTSLAEAEQAIREKLTGIKPDALAYRSEEYLGPDFMNFVNDLAIRIHEINIIKMELLERGTDKPDWGDGDHIGFDAQAIFKQFHAHAHSLSELRKVKAALVDQYKEEEEDIEDIYDQVRIAMKENRER